MQFQTTATNIFTKSIHMLKLRDFTFVQILGEGAFARVYKVELKAEKKLFALKEISKEKIYSKSLIREVYEERDIMISIYHPFVVNLYCTFQNEENLYMLMDYLPGKDLRHLINHMEKNFCEDEIRFIAACIILGLGCLHSKGIVHQDIKPENILFDEKGYATIADFSIAKKINKANEDVCGTLGYMSPETLENKRKLYCESDYYSLGLLLYEISFNERLLKEKIRNDSIKEINEMDLNSIFREKKKFNYSAEMLDFISKLLIKDVNTRLGHNGIKELKDHEWFKFLPWMKLHYKSLKSPFFTIIREEIKKQRKTRNGKINVFNNNTNNVEKLTKTYDDYFQKEFSHFNLVNRFNPLQVVYYDKDRNLTNLNRTVSNMKNKILRNKDKDKFFIKTNTSKNCFKKYLSFNNKIKTTTNIPIKIKLPKINLYSGITNEVNESIIENNDDNYLFKNTMNLKTTKVRKIDSVDFVLNKRIRNSKYLDDKNRTMTKFSFNNKIKHKIYLKSVSKLG